MKDNYSKRERVSRMRHFVACVLMLFGAGLSTAFAQSYISGTVTDAQGNPLVGVNVIVKGTTVGTMTTSDGSYRLDTPPRADVLIFSYLGMKGQELAINGRTEINVVMQEDAARMDEVVVVGYGTQKKVHLTGSIAAVSDDEIKKSTVSTISQALVGKLPGLITQQATGAPGSDGVTMLVRGYTSYNGSSPLVLVDGVERQMGTVDPNDVETVTILKDASASAVYGMKAAAGVILITTKRGHQGAMSINYRGNVTLSQMTTMPDFMNGTQYMEYYNAGLALDKLGGDDVPDYQFTPEEIAMTYNGDPSDGYENTDWMSPMRRLTLMHQHNLSVSGGSEKARYFVSGGFRNQEGIIKGHEDSRGNLRSNVDLMPHDNLRVQLNVAASLQDYYQPGAYSYANQEGYNIFHQMMYSIPFVPKWLEKDGTVYPVSGYRASWSAASPEYGSAHSGFSKSRNLRLETSANVEYSVPFVKGLKLGMFTSWDYHYYTGRTFSHSYEVLAYTFQRGSGIGADPLSKYSLVNAANLTPDGNLYVAHSNDQRVVLRPQISYANKFGKHDVGALFLYEQTTYTSESMNAGRRDFPVFDLPELNFGDPTTATNASSSGKSAFAGFVGRLNYAYDDKYLIEASFRYDGSYLFHKDHRWGFFPSFSLGWRISEEPFFEGIREKFNNFKIRYSYGQLGNQNVGYYDYIRKISIGNQNYLFGGDKPTTATISAPVVSNLSWETSIHNNLGVDMSFLNNRLAFSADFYIRDTKDMLTSGVALPSVYGADSPKMNSADLRTKGYELSLSWRDEFQLLRRPFTYSVTVTFNDYVTDITKYDNPDRTFAKSYYEGMRWGEIWGYRIGGLFATDAEAAGYAVDQTAVNNRINAAAGSERGLHAGDLKFLDLDGDNVISIGKNTVDDPGDREIIGNSQPRFHYGTTLSMSWAGIDFSIFFQGIGRRHWYPKANTIAFWGPYARPYASWIPKDFHEMYWSEENPDAYFPRPRGYVALSGTNRELTAVNDRYMQNIRYCRLKNLTIGYTLPKKWTRKVLIENLRVYFTGENLATWSPIHSDYIDPEMAAMNDEMRTYPWQKTYMFGVDVTF